MWNYVNMRRVIISILVLIILVSCKTVQSENNRLTSIEKYYINSDNLYVLIVERIVVNTINTEIFLLGSIGGKNRIYRSRISLGATDHLLIDNQDYIFRMKVIETKLKKNNNTFYITYIKNGDVSFTENITFREISAERLKIIEDELKDRMTKK